MGCSPHPEARHQRLTVGAGIREDDSRNQYFSITITRSWSVVHCA